MSMNGAACSRSSTERDGRATSVWNKNQPNPGQKQNFGGELLSAVQTSPADPLNQELWSKVLLLFSLLIFIYLSFALTKDR